MAEDTIVRGIDNVGDWVFGLGKQSYRTKVEMVAQRIITHIRSWYGNCFFDLTAGIDWYNYLGNKKTERKILLSCRHEMIKIQEITAIRDLSLSVDEYRRVTIYYEVETIYGTISNNLEVSL